MNRGETPTITYSGLPFPVSDIVAVRIYLYGSRKLVFSDHDITIGEDFLQITLTQEQTLSFQNNDKIRMQIRVRTRDQNTYTSDIMEATIGEILEPEVI